MALACLLLSYYATAKTSHQTTINLSQNEQQQWFVEYQLAKKVTKLEFRRGQDNSRSKRWIDSSGQFEIKFEQGVEFVRHKQGHSFSQVKFQLTPTYKHLPKDYAPFMPFSDGGLALHSARYFICLEKCTDDLNQWNFNLAVSNNSNIITNGIITQHSAKWSDSDSGQYVYVGPAKIITDPHFNAIVDPGLPLLLKNQLKTTLPQLMDYYQAKLGKPTTATVTGKPLLFASYGQTKGSGFSRQGGTLPGQIFVHWSTSDITKLVERPNIVASTIWFFAHEAAHFHQRYFLDEQFAWGIEGSADFMAYLGLSELLPQGQAFAQNKLAELEKQCQLQRKTTALSEALSEGKYNMFYQCGAVIAKRIHQQMLSQKQSQGLYQVWRVFNEDTGEMNESDDFFRHLEQQTSTKFVADIKAFITNKNVD
jgi:hypothetical protein